MAKSNSDGRERSGRDRGSDYDRWDSDTAAEQGNLPGGDGFGED